VHYKNNSVIFGAVIDEYKDPLILNANVLED